MKASGAASAPAGTRDRHRRQLGLARLLVVGALLTGCASEAQDLSTEQLSKVVAANRDSLQGCYQAALERTPYKSEVRMTANIFIQPSGAVRKVEVDKDGLKGMPECIEQAIAKWVFPKAPDETATTLPLVFNPEVVKQPRLDELPL